MVIQHLKYGKFTYKGEEAILDTAKAVKNIKKERG